MSEEREVQLKGKLVITDKPASNMPDGFSRVLVGGLLYSREPLTFDGDWEMIDCKVTITVTQRYKGSRPIGTLEDAIYEIPIGESWEKTTRL